MKSKTPILIAIVAVAALAGGFLAANLRAPGKPAELTAGTQLKTPRPLPDFRLASVDENGAEIPFTPESLQGGWHLVFFGFTHCPDVCPNTLFMLDKVNENLAGLDNRPEVVFVSVDAQRDTPAIASDYAKYFDKSFIGVAGDDVNLRRLAQGMSVAYDFKPEGDSYTVIHSSTVLLIDPQGRLHTIFTPPLHANAIAADVRSIIEE